MAAQCSWNTSDNECLRCSMRQNLITNPSKNFISAWLKAAESSSIGDKFDLAPYIGNRIQGGRVSRCWFSREENVDFWSWILEESRIFGSGWWRHQGPTLGKSPPQSHRSHRGGWASWQSPSPSPMGRSTSSWATRSPIPATSSCMRLASVMEVHRFDLCISVITSAHGCLSRLSALFPSLYLRSNLIAHITVHNCTHHTANIPSRRTCIGRLCCQRCRHSSWRPGQACRSQSSFQWNHCTMRQPRRDCKQLVDRKIIKQP